MDAPNKSFPRGRVHNPKFQQTSLSLLLEGEKKVSSLNICTRKSRNCSEGGRYRIREAVVPRSKGNGPDTGLKYSVEYLLSSINIMVEVRIFVFYEHAAFQTRPRSEGVILALRLQSGVSPETSLMSGAANEITEEISAFS